MNNVKPKSQQRASSTNRERTTSEAPVVNLPVFHSARTVALEAKLKESIEEAPRHLKWAPIRRGECLEAADASSFGDDAWAFGDEGFSCMPKPSRKRADWLAVAAERPQPLKLFRKLRHNVPHSTFRTIFLIPLGSFSGDDAPSLGSLAELARRTYQIDVEILPSQKIPETVEMCRNEFGDAQFSARDLCSALPRCLSHQQKRRAFCVMGLSMNDIFNRHPGFFVAGLGNAGEGSGIFSFHRGHPRFYDDAFDASCEDTDKHYIFERAAKVLVHELGHIFGLPHCQYYLCVMNGSNHPGELEHMPCFFCPVCLAKVHDALKLDLRRHFEELRDFWRTHGSQDVEHFYDARISCLPESGIESQRK